MKKTKGILKCVLLAHVYLQSTSTCVFKLLIHTSRSPLQDFNRKLKKEERETFILCCWSLNSNTD